MADDLRPGLTGEAELQVASEHAADRFGAAGMDVFASAIMVGLMENAAINAADHLLPAGSQTVGTGMTFKHTAPTPLQGKVRARAELLEVDGRRLVFRVEAFDSWESIGSAEHERFVVQRERFMQRVNDKAARPPAS
jgi:predicted thioesterase